MFETGDDCGERGIAQTAAEGELQGLEIGHDVGDLLQFIGVDAFLLDTSNERMYVNNHRDEVRSDQVEEIMEASHYPKTDSSK